MKPPDLDHTIGELLARLGTNFRLDHRLSGRPLGELFEETIRDAAARELAEFGTPGDRSELARSADGIMHFSYRPHLFPGMDESLRLGHLVQFALLPRELPDDCPIEAAAMLESYCHLSGDFFGWQPAGGGSLTAWMLDMSGHGVRAGFGAVVMNLILSETDPALALPDLAEEVERKFLDTRHPDDPGILYATGVFLSIAPDGGIDYLSAGHPPVLVRRDDGAVEEFGATSVPLVLFPEMKAAPGRFTATADDTVLVYTDGLVELCNPDGHGFGIDRTARLLTQTPGPPTEVLEALTAAVAGFHDLERLDDDLSLLVIRMRNRT